MNELRKMVFASNPALLDTLEQIQCVINESSDYIQDVYAVCDILGQAGQPRSLLSGQDILVVDDDDAELRLLAASLYTGGAKVSCVPDGIKAVEIGSHTVFDLMVLDVCMPTMTGFEVASRLRHQGYMNNIILATANFSKTGFEASLKAGCQAYIDKQIGPYYLLAIATFFCQGH